MLEINKNHKKANLNNLNKPLKTIAATLSIPVVMFVYSGASLSDDVYAYDQGSSITQSEDFDTFKIESEIEEIPDSCRDNISSFCKNGKITKKEVEKMKFVNINVDKDESLEFLKYFKNVEELHIGFEEIDSEILNTIPYLPKLKKLGLACVRGEGSLNHKADKFLKRLDKYELDELYLSGLNTGENTLEERPKIKVIRIENTTNMLLDVTKLKSILDVSYNGNYNTAIFITYDQYTALKRDNRIKFSSEKEENKFIDITKRLDKKVENLNIDSDMSDEDKILKIVANNLDEFKYYPYLDKENEKGEILCAEDFDKGGSLYGPMELGYGVCEGASLQNTADLHRIGIKSIDVQSIDHSFLMVNAEGKIFVIDPTWLDTDDDVLTVEIPVKDKKGDIVDTKEKTAKGEKREKLLKWASNNNIEVTWYMTNPSRKNMKKLDDSGSHNYYENFDDVKTLLTDLSDKKVSVKLKGQILNMNFMDLLATLSSLGIARPKDIKNKTLVADNENIKTKTM